MSKLSHLLAILALFGHATAKAREARVSIRNNSGRPMYNVSVVHKYSNVYKDNYTWPVVLNGELAPDNMTVRYKTGFFKGGLDWWSLAWVDDRKTPYITAPLNFRQVADCLEARVPRLLPVGVLTAVGLGTAGAGAVVAIISAVATAIILNEFTDHLFNLEPTVGFKEHMLRAEDADTLTEIIIKSTGVVKFKSKSGKSWTKSRALMASDVEPVDMSPETQRFQNATDAVVKLEASGASQVEMDEAVQAVFREFTAWLETYDTKTNHSQDTAEVGTERQ